MQLYVKKVVHTPQLFLLICNAAVFFYLENSFNNTIESIIKWFCKIELLENIENTNIMYFLFRNVAYDSKFRDIDVFN